MSQDGGEQTREERYAEAARAYGGAIDRLARGYEADADKRHDLRQEIHLQLWRSLAAFDGRCSLKTWVFRVAHNTAVSYVNRERRNNRAQVGLEEIEAMAADGGEPDIDAQRAMELLWESIRSLKALDRQVLILYLEEMDLATIAEITGLSAANVGMKIHRIKRILASRFHAEKRYV